MRLLGLCSVDLFASRLNTQLPLYELETRPLCNGNRCIHSQLDRLPGLCVSTILPNREVSTEDLSRESNNSFNCPSLANSSVVPPATRDVSPVTDTIAQPQGTSAGSIQSNPPSACQQTTATSHLESIRRAHSDSGILIRASEIISAGWRKGTNTTLPTKWSGWCNARGLNPFSCDVKHFLDFLSKLFNSGLQHRSINVIRSAVSITHKKIDGVVIGQHPLVSRLMRGVYNLRPPKPRYSVTWDVDAVVHYITNMGDNSNLLMALVVASRVSELQALDLRFRVHKPDGVLFRLTGPTKTQKVGSPPKEWFFGAFLEKQLCVVDCLKHYEEATRSHRTFESDSQPLFLSYIKPYKPVTSQRITHWIKDILCEAGVDTQTGYVCLSFGLPLRISCSQGFEFYQ